MKISVIATVFNESEHIDEFVQALISQSRKADEIIIVDGGSTDDTVKRLKKYPQLTIGTAKGNRSVGRNKAIAMAHGEIIAITDAGCVADNKWLEELAKPFVDTSIDVVAGYYSSRSETLFQKCLVPFALVMPDRIDPSTFLPATRSMAIKKSVWKEIGGFNEQYSHNEDYVFAKKLQRKQKKIVFAKDAVVYWIPRRTIKEAYVMFYRFAYGDMEAGLIRPKVLLLFARYGIGIILLFIFFLTQSQIVAIILLIGICLYVLWSIFKNYVYVRQLGAFLMLPFIQLLADVAVLHGSLIGIIKRYGI